jgi:signal transduction histidine kinase
VDENDPAAAAIEGSLIDITERKQYEEELSQHRNSLQQLVEEQTRKMIQESEQATRAKSSFLSNMSHELRTPMHAILSYSDMGLTAIEEEKPENIKKYFRNINTSGRRLLELLNQLLDLSKMESGRMVYNRQDLDFVKVIEQLPLLHSTRTA